MGANWANTLRLFRDLAPERLGPWEVYAFEANPLIQPYVDDFVRHLNGEGPRPPLLVPPTGSTLHLAELAVRYDCPRTAARPISWLEERMRQCMFERFQQPLSRLQPREELRSGALIAARLAEASRPAPGPRDRYTFIPAAVGGTNGTLHLGMVDPNQAIRGGAHSGGPLQHSGAQTEVALVDAATWMMTSFSDDDFVFLKMDVEGGELAILHKLMDNRAAGRIKLMAFECHWWAGNCPRLEARIRAETGIRIVREQPGRYGGWDSFSDPAVYYPVDPRKPSAPADPQLPEAAQQTPAPAHAGSTAAEEGGDAARAR